MGTLGSDGVGVGRSSCLPPSDSMLLMLFTALVPLSYYSISGVRVIVLLPLLLLGQLVVAGGKRGDVLFTKPSSSFYVFCALLVYAIFVTMRSGAVDILVAMCLFFGMAYWPFFIDRTVLERDTFRQLVKLYVVFSLAIAAAVVLQFGLFSAYGYEFGRVNFYRDRVAFSYIWMDFSFVSLYLTSAIPLLFLVFRVKYSLLLATLLIAASVLTSARTGVVALVFAVFMFYAARVLSRIGATGQFRIKHVLALVVAPVLGGMVVLLTSLISVRNVTFSDSGRFSGYLNAYHFWTENVWFGAWLDAGWYGEVIDLVPHNVVLYLLAVGGVSLLLLFGLWFSAVCLEIRRAQDMLKLSLLICLIGFLFIPSIFSAYFVGFLISLAFVHAVTSRRGGGCGKSALNGSERRQINVGERGSQRARSA